MNIAFTVIMTFRSPPSQCFNHCAFHRCREAIKFCLPKGKTCYLWPCPPSDTSSGVPTSGGRKDDTLACPSAERKMKKSSSAGNLTLGETLTSLLPPGDPQRGFPKRNPPPNTPHAGLRVLKQRSAWHSHTAQPHP